MRPVAALLAALAAIDAHEEVGTGCKAGVDCKPPRGWRSWNCYADEVTQSRMMAIMDAFVDSSRGISLKDLGYIEVGLDDSYQLCRSGEHNSFHAWTNDRDKLVAMIDTRKFPDMKGMVDYAHERGLKAGFYANNCICMEMNYHKNEEIEAHYQGDAFDMLHYGFDSIKLDGCGEFKDLERWQRTLNATGKYYAIESCHWGLDAPTREWCPYSYFRTSKDIKPTWFSVFKNLQTMHRFLEYPKALSRKGCWAYADMLEVGNLATYEENRSHFAAWAITSNPLILGLDVMDQKTLDSVWDIISNEEILDINEVWAGHPGFFVKRQIAYFSPMLKGSAEERRMEELTEEQLADLQAEPNLIANIEGGMTQAWDYISHMYDQIQIWAKPQPNGKLAVLVLNNAAWRYVTAASSPFNLFWNM
uniref:Alpha-galactosidase n=1 Tax=Phaeomonas parva TaxID=124430 RepID=A0A6U4G2I8_9STRA|mmetsp:Transcript_28547/g.91537  ORF Transcript_28547/g.91537 Transcript_28547/m.91537 type:complete len:418 (+) Transcript_28547:95-1348(+)